MQIQPEHAINAYQQEHPSIDRLILEAKWAHYHLTYTLEDQPDSEIVPSLRRNELLHLGALTDVLALRTQEPDLYETARDHGELLRKADGLVLDDHPRNGLDHLRNQYGLLHGHAHGASAGHSSPETSPPPRLPNYPAGHRLIYQMCDTYTWATIRNPALFPSTDIADEQRRHLLCRGILLDWAAAAAPADAAAAEGAAAAGHTLRKLDGKPTLDDARARAYLLDSFRDLYDQDNDETDLPHPPDCAGGCAGDGELLTILTWEAHGGGIYVPVHQEPIACLGTAHTEHDPDCHTCNGHGYTYQRGYRDLCLGGRLPSGAPTTETSPVPQEGPRTHSLTD